MTATQEAPATKPSKWWMTAPNPPCPLRGCKGHGATEFTNGAGIVCIQSVMRTDMVRIEVDQCSWGDDEPADVVNVDTAKVYIEVDRAESYALEDAERIGKAILDAVARARRDGGPRTGAGE